MAENTLEVLDAPLASVSQAQAIDAANEIPHLLGVTKRRKQRVVLDRVALAKIGAHAAQNDPTAVLLGQTIAQHERMLDLRERMMQMLESDELMPSEGQGVDDLKRQVAAVVAVADKNCVALSKLQHEITNGTLPTNETPKRKPPQIMAIQINQKG